MSYRCFAFAQFFTDYPRTLRIPPVSLYSASLFNKRFFIELKSFLLLQFAPSCAILIPIRKL